jgi:type IV secretion system protein VirB8
MTGVTPKDLEAYFERSRTYDGERVRAAARLQKVAWIIAGVSSAAAIASLAAVIGMLPLRTVEVHVFRVDTATGVVDLVSPLKGTQTYDEAITKYWSALYVRMREGFLVDEAPHAFRTVTLMSGERELQRFAEFYGPRNPQSPQIVHRDGRAVVTIKSITFPTRSLALVRFARTVTRGGQKSESHWVATLGFEYVAAPMAESDRSINPLGFIVNEYRIDPEVL